GDKRAGSALGRLGILRRGQGVGQLVGGCKNPCGVGFGALRGHNEPLLLRQSARVMTLPPGCPLELVAQLNPGMACRGPATSRFRLSFGSHAVECTLVTLTWILHKDERAIGLRPHQIETCLRGQRRAQVQSLWPSRPK